jgi:hypothetical protein
LLFWDNFIYLSILQLDVEIDHLVYALYGLTAAKIAVVEGKPTVD